MASVRKLKDGDYSVRVSRTELQLMRDSLSTQAATPLPDLDGLPDDVRLTVQRGLAIRNAAFDGLLESMSIEHEEAEGIIS